MNLFALPKLHSSINTARYLAAERIGYAQFAIVLHQVAGFDASSIIALLADTTKLVTELGDYQDLIAEA
jgi:hypothetical protein